MNTEIQNAIALLRINMNGEDTQDFRLAFRYLHRTEKQNVIRNVVHLLEEAAIDCEMGMYDMRNEASCKWALAALEIPRKGETEDPPRFFPYI